MDRGGDGFAVLPSEVKRRPNKLFSASSLINFSGCNTNWQLPSTTLATPTSKSWMFQSFHGWNNPPPFPETNLAFHRPDQGRSSYEGRSSTGPRQHSPRSGAAPAAITKGCQVDGCEADLIIAKDYHRKHRVCQKHSKAPETIVSGVEKRFCQQCSRFHVMTEFDENKRSCRRRLERHNQRRRKSHTILESPDPNEGRGHCIWTAGSAPSLLSSAVSLPFTDFPSLADGTGSKHVATTRELAADPLWIASLYKGRNWEWCGDDT